GTVVRLWPSDVPAARRDSLVRSLAKLLNVPEEDIRDDIERVSGDPLTPVIVRSFVRDAKAEFILEHRDEFPGVEIVRTEVRDYPEGRLGAHLLGFVGEVSAEELERLDPAEYAAGDQVGKAGVEVSYDSFLRGKPGTDEVRLNARGEIVRQRRTTDEPELGNALRLTIDADVQRAAEEALARGVRQAKTHDALLADGGAVVAIDPRDGAIRALASFPDFDPAIWSGRRSSGEIGRLSKPSENSPGLDRALEALYPPGSAFKPVTALAALAEQNATGTAPLMEADEPIPCTSRLLVDGQVFRNWQPRNEPLKLRRALAESCDTYFYGLGLRFFNLPPERGSPLQFWARRMGFGEPTGVDLGPESDGLLPTPEWRRQRFTDPVDRLWKSGDSVQLSIGQGDLLVTPLQMARFYALLANGGKLVEPHIAMWAEKPGTGEGESPTVLRRFSPAPPRDVGLNPAWVRAVNDGLFDATHEDYGTSRGTFGGYAVPIAGKTGTAEKFVTVPKGTLGLQEDFQGLQDQAWWCGFGPVEADKVPELAVCVVIENGGLGGESAAPVALKVFEAYFGVKAPKVGTGDVFGQTD
ncbi:MAG: penicillin-binding transpeptidase domain-containing protein, partial [Gaiellales bacterium]